MKDSEGFEPVSPRKHISQRRRTAEALAEAEFRRTTVYAIPKSPNAFGPLEEHESMPANHTNDQSSSVDPGNIDYVSSEESALVTEPLHDDYATTESSPRVEDVEEEKGSDSTHEKR